MLWVLETWILPFWSKNWSVHFDLPLKCGTEVKFSKKSWLMFDSHYKRFYKGKDNQRLPHEGFYFFLTLTTTPLASFPLLFDRSIYQSPYRHEIQTKILILLREQLTLYWIQSLVSFIYPPWSEVKERKLFENWNTLYCCKTLFSSEIKAIPPWLTKQ